MNRFLAEDEVVTDTQTGLMWSRNAAPAIFPLSWNESLGFIKELNHAAKWGYTDWKLPNRKELLSVMSHTRINPCLPQHHPFINVFTGYYWTATTCTRLPGQAWYIHLGGARVYKGMKHHSYMVWPVRVDDPTSLRVFQTGQIKCYDDTGKITGCEHTGQDGELQSGRRFETPRFTACADLVYDHATELTWLKNADSCNAMLDWQAASEFISAMNKSRKYGFSDWRLPTILELEHLTDMGRHSPALPDKHPFTSVRAFYWSSTTSMYDPTYAWALYMQDGAVGVGFKRLAEFHLWPVR